MGNSSVRDGVLCFAIGVLFLFFTVVVIVGSGQPVGRTIPFVETNFEMPLGANENLPAEVDVFDSHNVYLDCLSAGFDSSISKCLSDENEKGTVSVRVEPRAFSSDALNEGGGGQDIIAISVAKIIGNDVPVVITLVYFFLAALLSMAMYCGFSPAASASRFKRYQLTDFCCSAAPMLGMLGTFYSLAIALLATNSSSIGEGIVASFFDAVMTSIVGILFYIVCSYIRSRLAVSAALLE